MSFFRADRPWDVAVMFTLLGALFVFEMLGVYVPKMVTITEMCKALIPMPCRVMILAWLVWHFFISDIVKLLTPSK